MPAPRFALAFALAMTLAAGAFAQPQPDPLLDRQISQFVRRIHEDRRGHLWFGTNGDGVIRHDGASLQTFGPREGFGGYAVRGIVEEADGTLWFGTEQGLTRYDGAGFTRVPIKDGPVSPGFNDVWALTIDSEGVIWVGTLEGASRFDGETFTPVELPETARDDARGVSSERMVHAIMADGRGRLWFATSGGVFIRDGGEPTGISTRDGLCGDVVNDVLEARDGSVWFATHHHGVCRLKDGGFVRYGPEDGVEGTEAWSLFEDSAGNVWFPTEGYGVYRFDGETFTNFGQDEGLLSGAVQCVAEDRQGRILVGGHLGVYRLEEGRFVNLTRALPWP